MIHMDLRSFAVLAFFLSATFLPTGGARSQVSLEALVDTFIRVVERGEYGEKSVGVTRWTRPIRVAVAGVATDDQAAALDQHLGELSRRMGLSVREVSPIAVANRGDGARLSVDLREPTTIFQVMYHLPAHGWSTYLVHGRGDNVSVHHGDVLVVFTEHASATQIARILRLDSALARSVASNGSPCFTLFYTEPASHELKYGIVVLRTDVPDWLRRRCLHEEMTQVMGLRNDVKGSEITLFDDMPARKRTDLTPYDWMFLEILYDPRMKPGIAGAELRRLARELIAERMARKE